MNNISNRQRNLGSGVQYLLDYLKRMQAENPGFFYAIEGDNELHFGNAFWADATSRGNYSYFGDTVRVDTSYRSDRSKIPFVTFTGINHHAQPVLFGCALILNESDNSFIWLLQTWLRAMSGRSPVSITIDPDRLIQMAVAQVLPEARTRFCRWSIFRQTQEKLTNAYQTIPTFDCELKKCVNEAETVEEFESCWATLLGRYFLMDNDWLQSLYNIRGQWVPVYLRDVFFGELSPLDCNDILGLFFNGFLSTSPTMQLLIKQYEKVISSWQDKELKDDFDTSNTTPVLKTPSPMEKQAANLYTRRIFMKFQGELVETLANPATVLDDSGTVTTFRVAKFGEEHKAHIVRFNACEMKATCSCQMFEFSGIICRHVLSVFRAKNVLMLPSEYVLKRWTRNAKTGGEGSVPESAFRLPTPMILPPLDVEWVWYCHTLNPVNYRHYCESRFAKLIGKPAIFDEENEGYALNRCREIWECKFPSEPFENKSDSNLEYESSVCKEDLLDQVSKQRNLCRRFSEPYYSEMVYLVAAKQRYRGFIYMVHRFGDDCSTLVPTSDVLLMWLTHKSYPTDYALDVKELEGNMETIVGVGETVKEEDIEETKMLWERTFDQPYEKAGVAAIARSIANETPFCWDVTDSDVNTRYKSMVPRFLLEVCISVKVMSNAKQMRRDLSREFLRLRMLKCHKELKIDKPVSYFTSESWQKSWHLYCEFGTRGLILELRHCGGCYSRGSSVRESISFTWNDLLRAPSLILGKEIDDRLRTMTSITSPVQGSYLLKCVPDRATDNSGAMISDVILKMNQYRPQEGRWLSRTVLDHAGRECFVVRMRVGGGIWRRGGEAPTAVKWEDRIIEIREGSWSYVAGSSSIGRSPANVVGTANPKEPPEGFQASWSFSTGSELLIKWDASKSISGLRFDLQNKLSSEPMAKLLLGRQLQYQVMTFGLETKAGKQEISEEEVKEDRSAEEDEFVTLVRFSEDNPTGKATALLNWKLLAVELLPEEDAVQVLLLCLSILRSISEMKKEDVGNLLVRRRVKEAKIGDRDWGSVVLHPLSYSPSVSCPYLLPWYWHARVVMASPTKDQVVSPPSPNYSQAEGGDKLYKTVIMA